MPTVGATWYYGCPGAYSNLCDGGLYYAELGVAGANAYMGGLLGKAAPIGSPEARHEAAYLFRGKTVIASTKDAGSA